MGSLRIVINTAGLLHDGDLQPEKRLSQVRRGCSGAQFRRQCLGPRCWWPRPIEPALPRDQPVHFASLSARVGSITDNQLGGWYAYRAAKAAQNQLLKTLALEWRRRLPLACVTLLHPGTTATPLSAPFRCGVPAEKLFSPERAAGHLLDVLEGQDARPERQLPGLGRQPPFPGDALGMGPQAAWLRSTSRGITSRVECSQASSRTGGAMPSS